MDCPVCPRVTLQVVFREGIEIDYCPKCRGVWLDRGELEKIIERSQGVSETPGRGAQERNAPTPERRPPHQESQREGQRPQDRAWGRSHDDDDHDEDNRENYDRDAGRLARGQPKKRGGFLSNLFEFGD